MTRPADGAFEEPETGAPSSRPRGVLVIDDNEAVRAVLRAMLRASGLAADGHEGVAVYGEHVPAIDLVLLDVRMPGRDGPETLLAIRAISPQIPCCVISGGTGEYTEPELLGLGARAVLRKPFRFDELIARVAHLTASSTRQDS